MKVCIVAEGCYPYVVGGVSSWIHSMIKSFPKVDFIVLSIIANREISGKFEYELPPNVESVQEAYLDDQDWSRKAKRGRRTRLNKKEYNAVRSLLFNDNVDWDTLFDLFEKKHFSIDDMLMGADFLRIVAEVYDRNYSQIVFSDFLWTMRSIYLPMFLIMKTKLPKADIYHCVATGYAGLIGAAASRNGNTGLLISEHGIYTREREEEILKAKWVSGIYKNIWIDQFKKMSTVAYQRADVVTSLFGHARELQIELGCPADKIKVTPNGISTERFENLPGKLPEDEGIFNVGAVLRVSPIKDVKTLISAFGFATERNPRLKLWIMGPTNEDEEYAEECFDLVDTLKLTNVVFTGRVNVTEYLGRMDCTILTSISEGQPLTILEGFAAGKPAIATDVGNCRGLLYGEEGDEFGDAGILTHIMNVEEITNAILDLASHPDKCRQMGEAGKKRALAYYRIEYMKKTYKDIYSSLGGRKQR